MRVSIGSHADRSRAYPGWLLILAATLQQVSMFDMLGQDRSDRSEGSRLQPELLDGFRVG